MSVWVPALALGRFEKTKLVSVPILFRCISIGPCCTTIVSLIFVTICSSPTFMGWLELTGMLKVIFEQALINLTLMFSTLKSTWLTMRSRRSILTIASTSPTIRSLISNFRGTWTQLSLAKNMISRKTYYPEWSKWPQTLWKACTQKYRPNSKCITLRSLALILWSIATSDPG